MKKFYFLIVLTFVCLDMSAQRLMPGQKAFDFGGSAWSLYGGEVGMNFIGYNNKLMIRASGLFGQYDYGCQQRKDDVTGEVIPYEEAPVFSSDIYASFGMDWNMVHNRSHSVNFWGGVTVDLGARIRSCMWYDFDSGRIPSASFLFGFTPELAFEFFLGKSFSMTVFARPRLQFFVRGSDYKDDESERWFYPETGMLFTFYL